MAHHSPFCGAAAAAIAAVAALAVSTAAVAGESPPRRRPADGNATLLVLPASLARSKPATDAAGAATEAESYLQLARTTGDTRYFGRAEAAVLHWQTADRVPIRIDMVSADLEQQRHAFDAARRRLDRVLAADPRHAQARLKRANLGLLAGEYAAARRDCLGVALAGHIRPGAVCLAAALAG